jgi:hypothetical protein
MNKTDHVKDDHVSHPSSQLVSRQDSTPGDELLLHAPGLPLYRRPSFPFLFIATMPCVVLALSVILLGILGTMLQYSPLVIWLNMQSEEKQAFMLPAKPTIMKPGAVTPTPALTPSITSVSPTSTVGPGNITTSTLQVTLASYLGNAGSNVISAVDVAPDGMIVIGGTMPEYAPAGASIVNVLNGGNGVVIRLDSTGHAIRSVTHIGNLVRDISVNDSGQIVVCGDFGVALLDPTASTALWNAQPGFGGRCALGNDGMVALLVGIPKDGTPGGLLSGGMAYLYSGSATPVAQWSVGGSWQSDITIDATHQVVIATGFTQYAFPVQVAFLHAWSYNGSLLWRDYDFSENEVSTTGLTADTRGLRVAMGRDGMLYFAGTSAGGNSIYNRDPKASTVKPDQSQLIGYDSYTVPSSTSSTTITWYGRYNPVDGTLLKGQFLLTRNPAQENQGNTISPAAVMADEYGRVYLAGVACNAIAKRDVQKIAGIPVAAYSGCESFVLVTRADLQQRLIWTTFTAGGPHSATAYGISVRRGVAVAGVTLNGGSLITHNALQGNPGGAPSAYIAAWSQAVE